ncbi:hypothetical protein ACFW1M_36975 [Streptomyces inhibens]|uniref:hypothetical protein n=1 Tax=Streptomyces inhibens TaxID=2293571 RepID=UPI0036B79012
MPYTYEGNWLCDATGTERGRLEAVGLSVLARPYDQAPPGAADFLATPGPGSALHCHVEAQRAYYAWLSTADLAPR